MSDKLPQGWISSRVAELFLSHGGGTPNRGTAAYWGGDVPWLSSGDIKATSISESSETITKRGLEKSAARLCRKGSVLVVVRSGILKHTLPVAVLEREASINQDIKSFDSGHDELNKWLSLAWRASARKLLVENREGTTVQSVKLETLKDFVLPLAPLAEQRRIVAKLETLLGKVDASQQRLAKIPVLLKRFRQSVLAAACSGRLTADWREKYPAVETAEALLVRIKEKRLASAKTQKQRVQIEEVFDERNLRIDEGDLGLNDIPNTWLSCRVGAIGAVCNGSTPSRKQPEFWGGAIPWVSSGEVRNNLISETRERITKAGYEGSSVRLLPRGPVLIAMIGEGKTRGQTAIINIEATINQNIAAVVLDHGLVISHKLSFGTPRRSGVRMPSTLHYADRSPSAACNLRRLSFTKTQETDGLDERRFRCSRNFQGELPFGRENRYEIPLVEKRGSNNSDFWSHAKVGEYNFKMGQYSEHGVKK